jgi:hypothetical protein
MSESKKETVNEETVNEEIINEEIVNEEIIINDGIIDLKSMINNNFMSINSSILNFKKIDELEIIDFCNTLIEKTKKYNETVSFWFDDKHMENVILLKSKITLHRQKFNNFMQNEFIMIDT